MTHSIKGVVDGSYQKDKPKRAGGTVKIWYVDVDGVTFSTGFNQRFQQGEMIDVTVEQKYGEWQYVKDGGGSLPPATKMAPKGAGPKATGGGGFKRAASSFPIDPKDGQISIIRQSSMNRAIEVVEQLMAYELFKPKTEEEYMNKLIEVALEITDFASGQDITNLMKAKNAALEVAK